MEVVHKIIKYVRVIVRQTAANSVDTWGELFNASSLSYRPLFSFSPPQSCFSPTFTLTPQGLDSIVNSSILIQGVTSDCLPLGANTTGLGVGVSIQTFSPATCPYGYVTTTGSVTTAAVSGSDVVITWGFCCPGAMTLTIWSVSSTAEGYISYATSGFCYKGFEWARIVINGSETTSTYIPTIAQFPLAVAFQSQDLSIIQAGASTTSPSSATTSMPATPASSSSVPAQTSVTPVPQATTSSLSPGAIAGIAVGCIAAGLILILVVFLLWRKRKRSRDLPTTNAPETTFDKAELPGEGKKRAELDGDGDIREVEGHSKPPELETQVVSELDAGWRGWEAPSQRGGTHPVAG